MKPIVRYTRDGFDHATDELAEESPVEFRLGGVPIAVVMRTPGDDEHLGLGFALTEGIVLSPNEVSAISHVGDADHEGDRYDITLAEGVVVDPEQFRRNLYTTSSCGVCGKASIDAVRVTARPMSEGPMIDATLLLDLPEAMRTHQTLFQSTGSVHAAAAFTPEGQLMAVAEDVGRHNAVDKLVGTLAKDTWPLGDLMLVVSGRLSFEMVQKAAVAGIPIIAGVSGASDLAVDLGEELDMTVIGFLSPDGFNIYAGSGRVNRSSPHRGV